ncbi:hypothetical protein NQU33_24090, partial [Escherichia coli]|nr:hypothetical protein [Escherichia coli]
PTPPPPPPPPHPPHPPPPPPHKSKNKLRVTMLVTRIYHNIRCVHRRRGPQRVSEASGLKHTPFCAHIEKKRP